MFLKLGKTTWRLIYGATTEFLKDDCSRAAAALAYYTLFAMAPVITLVIGVASLVMDPAEIQGAFASELESVVGPKAVNLLKAMVDSKRANATSWIAAGTSIVMLLFGATAVFAQIQAALNQAWGVMPDPRHGQFKKLASKRALSVGLILAMVVLQLGSVSASTLLALVGDSLDPWIGETWTKAGLKAANGGLSIAVFTLLFALTFRLLPDAKVQWRDVWVGAAVTACLLAVGKGLLAYYFQYAKVGSGFGAAGSTVLLLAFIYYASMIFLWGAEFTQVWARQHGRRIRPQRGAIRVVKKPPDEMAPPAA